MVKPASLDCNFHNMDHTARFGPCKGAVDQGKIFIF
jgi:hypothetical protein